MGIYWVYFKARLGHQMKLQIEADDRQQAVIDAENIAKNMGFGWYYDHCDVCR